MEQYRVEQPLQDPVPASYLVDPKGSKDAYDVHLDVFIRGEKDDKTSLVARSNLKYMYWTFKQQLAHHTINGCNMRTGDLLGSGTISGPTDDSYGSLLELSWNGSKDVVLENGDKRHFLLDGDEVKLVGHCEDGNGRIGFGNCIGVIIPQ